MFTFKTNPNKSLGALDLIHKCLTVLPANRFTVDDIAAHWWINIGYKHPPVHYYLTSTMQKTGITTASHPPPVLAYNGTKNTRATSERRRKTLTPPVPTSSHPPFRLSPPITLPTLRVQSRRSTDTESKSKATTNGHHQTIRSHRVNGNPTTTNKNKHETLKSNQSSRKSSAEKSSGGKSSKYPPPRTIVS